MNHDLTRAEEHIYKVFDRVRTIHIKRGRTTYSRDVSAAAKMNESYVGRVIGVLHDKKKLYKPTGTKGGLRFLWEIPQ